MKVAGSRRMRDRKNNRDEITIPLFVRFWEQPFVVIILLITNLSGAYRTSYMYNGDLARVQSTK